MLAPCRLSDVLAFAIAQSCWRPKVSAELLALIGGIAARWFWEFLGPWIRMEQRQAAADFRADSLDKFQGQSVVFLRRR